MFLCVDHFEPGGNDEIVDEWVENYPLIARNHRDADGKMLQHTWFYPCEQFKLEQLEKLTNLSAMGYGEIELHLHHRNDTSESFRQIIRDAKEDFGKVGALETLDGNKAFGFVHGNWALDNSIERKGGGDYCGVNDELTILEEEGCYADFTFPAEGTQAQPRQINSIYYAIDDPRKPKSYNTGIAVASGGQSRKDMIIIPGPLTINLKHWKHSEFPYYYPMIETGAIQGANPPLPFRVDEWVRAGIHVEGQPSWIFVKTYAHGAMPDARSVLLGKPWDDMHAYLGRQYNDGKKYRLHYVTAREAYNIVKAAEAGKKGNPNLYRDFIIPPYKTSLRKLSLNGTDSSGDVSR